MVSQTLPELLLVEDNPDDEEMSLRGIRQSGVPCRVTVRRDGQEALDHLSILRQPLPILVLLDFKLPKLDGLEVLKTLRSEDRTRALPVVIFSGSNDGKELHKCYWTGANSCVSKPIEAAAYIERVSWILRYWLTVSQMSDLSLIGEGGNSDFPVR